jgi:hypothetical protein
MRRHENSGQIAFFTAKTEGLEQLKFFLESLVGKKRGHSKNKMPITPREKPNAVLTLPLDANYNSCRTQNSFRTEIGVVAVDCNEFVLVREQL